MGTIGTTMPKPQLRAFKMDGTTLDDLPDHVGCTVQLSHNGPGTFTGKYPLNGRNAALLLDEGDVLLRPTTSTGWESPQWFLLADDSDDETDDNLEGRMLSLSAIEAPWAYLAEAAVFPQMHVSGVTPEELGEMAQSHAFKDETPGWILHELFTRAWARGALLPLDYDFGPVYDSYGSKWPTRYTVTYPAGLSYDRIVQDMCDKGWIHVRTEGNELKAYREDSIIVKRDRPGTILRLGQNVTDSNRKRSRTGVINAILGLGSEGNALELMNAAAIASSRRKEGYVGDGRIESAATLAKVVQIELNSRAQNKEGITLGYLMQDKDLAGQEEQPWPGSDYREGDFIRYDQRRLTATELEPLRVRTITWEMSPASGGGYPCSLEVNDLFLEAKEIMARKIDGIDYGSIVPGTPPPPGAGEDKTPPAAPEFVEFFTTASLPDSGQEHGVDPIAEATVFWEDPTHDLDGHVLDDLRSLVLGMRTYPDGGWIDIQADVSPGVEEFVYGPVTIGTTIQFRVRADDASGNRGPWATSEPGQVLGDVTPPPPPSAPTLESLMGLPGYGWDGMDEDGQPMPADFDRVELHISVDIDPTEATPLFDTRRSKGPFYPATSWETGTVLRAAMRAFDRSGNVSDFGPSTEAVVESLVDWDAALEEAIGILEDLSDNVIPGMEGAIVIAGGRFTASVLAPTEEDAEGLPEGALWSQYDGNNLIGTWVLISGVWETREPQQVHIDTGTFGTLDGVRLKAHTILAMSIGVGDFTNYVDNARTDAPLPDADSSGWELPTTDASFVAVTDHPATGGTHVLQLNADPARSRYVYNEKRTPLKVEETWLVEAMVRCVNGVTTPDSLILGMRLRDAGGETSARVTSFDAFPPADNEFHLISYEVDIVGTGWVEGQAVVGVNIGAIGLPTWQVTNVELRRKVGGVLIQDGAITAPKIMAGAIEADKIKANSIQAQHFEAVLAMAHRFVSGDPGGAAAELNPDGFELYGWDAERGRYLLAGLTADGDQVLRINEKAFIDRNGDASFRSVAASRITLAGEDLTASLWNMSKGMLERCNLDNDSGTYSDQEEFRVAELEFTVPDKPYSYLPGRAYCFSLNTVVYPETTGTATNGCGASLRVRYETGTTVNPPDQPTAASLLWGPAIVMNGLNTGRVHHASFRTRSFTWPAGTRVRVMVTAQGVFQTNLRMQAQSHFAVEDVGPWRADTGDPRSGDITGPVVGPETPYRTYQTIWTPSNTRTYLNGAAGGAFSQFPGALGQGWTPGLATARHSVIQFKGDAFGGDEVGTSISGALNGANVEAVHLRIRNRAFHPTNQWSGTRGRALVGWQNNWDAVPTVSVTQGGCYAGSWTDIPLDIGAWLQASGDNRFITLGPGTMANTDDWAAWEDHNQDDPPWLVITYRRAG